MADILSVADVLKVKPDASGDKLAALVDDAVALAYSVAPCLFEDDTDEMKLKAAKAILRQAVWRWLERGAGVNIQQSTGPYQLSVDNSHGNLFWPSEITSLQGLCSGGSKSQTAFAIDMTPTAVGPTYWTSTVEPGGLDV